MSAIPTYPTLRPARLRIRSRDSPTTPPRLKVLGFGFTTTAPAPCPPSSNSVSFSRKIGQIPGPIAALNSLSQEESLQELDDSPVSVDLRPISDETQFDRIIVQEQSVVFVWMASWCRKCIYLKPKLEKLAAEYYPSLAFYCIDVNSVPHKLVAAAEVTKMPTIQLWKHGKKQAEVIGGYKAHLVINEVRGMIENEDAT